MANIFLNLTPNVGADTSRMGRTKTFIADNAANSGSAIIEANCGGAWVEILKFSSPGNKTFDGAFKEIRFTGSLDVSVSANDDGAQFIELDLAGTPVDVSALGTFNTLTVGDPQGSLMIEISDDAVNWTQVKQFQTKTFASLEIVTKWMRAVHNGTGSPKACIGAVNDAQPWVGTSFQWSPDAPADKLVAGRVFNDFYECFSACVAARSAGFQKVEMIFDNRYSLTRDIGGLKTTRIPSSAVLGTDPVGGLTVKVWDFASIAIRGGTSSPSDQDHNAAQGGLNITFAEGAYIQPTKADLVLDWVGGAMHNGPTALWNGSAWISQGDAPTHSPIVPGVNWGVWIVGSQVKLACDAGAPPLIKPDPDSGFQYFPCGSNGLGGWGLGVGRSPAPILDCGGIFTVLGTEGTCTWVDDNAFTDSVGSGGIRYQGPYRNARNNNGQADHPGLGAQDTGSYIQNLQVFNLKTPVMSGKWSDGYSLYADGQTLQPGVCYCDTSGGDITVKAPCFASPISGTNVWIIPVGAGKVTLDPHDTANVRNPGGVPDTVSAPDVLPGMVGHFVANGGMGGFASSIGNWQRLGSQLPTSAAYTPTNVTPDRAFDADSVLAFTNNIAAGGSPDQADDWAIVDYPTDAEAIRNASYQMAMKISQLQVQNAELANVVGTIIADLKAASLLG